jgi:hypothetical protein
LYGPAPRPSTGAAHGEERGCSWPAELDSDRAATSEERGPCTTAEVVDLQPQSRLSALARRELALMYARVDRTRGRTYFFGPADQLRCRQKPADLGVYEYRTHGLNQYLSLTQATTVWASWPDPSSADDAATN